MCLLAGALDRMPTCARFNTTTGMAMPVARRITKRASADDCLSRARDVMVGTGILAVRYMLPAR